MRTTYADRRASDAIAAAGDHRVVRDESALFVERLDVGIADEVDRIQVLEVGEGVLDEGFADSSPLKLGEDFGGGDVAEQDSVGERGEESGDPVSALFHGEQGVGAVVEHLQMRIRGRRFRPSDEESFELVGFDAGEVGCEGDSVHWVEFTDSG